MRLENAIECFTRAHHEVTTYGWNPLEDESFTEGSHTGAPQRVLPLETAT
jgi:hypothetical protein